MKTTEICKHQNLARSIGKVICHDCGHRIEPDIACGLLLEQIDALAERTQSQLSNITNALCNFLNAEPCAYCGAYIRNNSADGVRLNETYVCKHCIPTWFQDSEHSIMEQKELDAAEFALHAWAIRNATENPQVIKWLKLEDPNGHRKAYDSIVK